MKRFLTLVLLLAALTLSVWVACADVVTNADPDQARIVIDDLERFWTAWDRAEGKDKAERIRAFQEEYYDPGSPGLHDFFEARIGSVEDLLAIIDTHPKYYASLRKHTAKASEFEQPTRQAFRKLKELYPAAAFPDVYIVIGRLSSGGTTSQRGLLIGADMYGMYPDTPTEELSDWLRAVLGPMDRLPHIIVHESMHFQQSYAQMNTLLAGAIGEGSADFLGELVSGKHINQHIHEWANPRERELWEKFREQMLEPGFQGWLYGGERPEGWPADVGYWMGYKITTAYYERAQDKKQAVADILNIQDFEAFLKASGYADKWQTEDQLTKSPSGD